MGQKREIVTRADVARLAGVSETVVSYVINNNRYVAKDKRQRVEEAVRTLNYRPNNVARALKGKQSNQLLFIADQITNEYFGRLVSEMDKYAYLEGYLISLCANRNTMEFVSKVISRQYDGIIISSASFPTEYIRDFSNAGIPVVLFQNRWYDEKYENVARLFTGLYAGAKDCVNHLLETGKNNIIYIDRISKHGHKSSFTDLRLGGFIDEMKKNNMAVDEKRIIAGCRNEVELRKAVEQKLKDDPTINGIIGRNDIVGCMAMTTAMDMGYRVPDDIGVIGFDNSSLSRFCSPNLSTVAMQQSEISRTAIKMLIDMIDGKKPEKAMFKAKLIQRESTVK